MTKDNLDTVQTILEDIQEECKYLSAGEDVDVCVHNIEFAVDSLYSVCESDYCDDSTDELPHGYEEIWPMLPDGNMLSVGDINRLKEHIEAWKEGN